MRVATAARLTLGAACVAAPAQLLAAVGAPDRDDTRTRAVVRVLGGRLLLQAAVGLAAGSRTRALDVAIDLTHAVSMLPVALLRPAHRRTALVSAALATGTALLDLPRSSAPGARIAARQADDLAWPVGRPLQVRV